MTWDLEETKFLWWIQKLKLFQIWCRKYLVVHYFIHLETFWKGNDFTVFEIIVWYEFSQCFVPFLKFQFINERFSSLTDQWTITESFNSKHYFKEEANFHDVIGKNQTQIILLKENQDTKYLILFSWIWKT